MHPSLQVRFHLNGRSLTLPLSSKVKVTLDMSCMNFRPISLLSLPSKILERIVHNQLLNHLLSNDLLSSRQFGFRPSSSTQEALLFATHDWSCYLDKGLSVAAVFFDLSKAFDKVPHCQLLSALANVGVSGSLLNWFRSYLNELSWMATPRKSTLSPLVYLKVPSWALFCFPSM